MGGAHWCITLCFAERLRAQTTPLLSECLSAVTARRLVQTHGHSSRILRGQLFNSAFEARLDTITKGVSRCALLHFDRQSLPYMKDFCLSRSCACGTGTAAQ